MSIWRATKAKRAYGALLRLGWRLKKQVGSHRKLQRAGWPNFTFCFHDSEEIGPAALSKIGKDTGLTARYLLHTLAGRQPNSLVVCTFLDKTPRRLVQVPVKFRCFEIPDRFVVGFGLDYNQLYRNLPYVAVMKV